MSTALITLPKDPDALSAVVNEHMARELSRTSYKRLMLLLYSAYLQGARHFSEFNMQTGHLHYTFQDPEGNLLFKSQKLLHTLNQFIGHFMAGSIRPSVVRSDGTLQGVRDRAICQAIVDAAVTDQQLGKFSPDFMFNFLGLGGCGVMQEVADHPVLGIYADMQVIHPCEMFPFPSLTNDRTKAAGLLWRRYVPVSFLQEKLGKNRIARLKDKLRTISISIGAPEQATTLAGGFETWWQGSGYGTYGMVANGKSNVDDRKVDMVEIRELYVDSPCGLSNRYVVQSGDAILIDEDRKGKEFIRPLRYLRCLDDGSWHGQGLCDLLFPYVREHELMVSNLIENIRTMSKYDVLVLPQSMLDTETAFRDVGHGLKVFTWQPDPMTENVRPSTVRQATSGDMPGKASAFIDSLMAQVSFPEILQGNAPGRVDSSSGLQFLDQQARKALNAPIANIQSGLGEIYRSITDDALRAYRDAGRPVPIGRLNIEMAGIKLDPKSSKMSIAGDGSIPDIFRLTFTTREAAPKNPAALKQEAQMYLQNQQLSVDQFKFYCIQEGLDASMPMGKERNSYEKCVRNIIILFNDGETPGEITRTPETNNPVIDGMVLEEFMQSFAFSMASPEVQDSFTAWYNDLQAQGGAVLPEGYMPPDEMALLRMGQQAAQPAEQGPPNG